MTVAITLPAFAQDVSELEKYPRWAVAITPMTSQTTITIAPIRMTNLQLPGAWERRRRNEKLSKF